MNPLASGKTIRTVAIAMALSYALADHRTALAQGTKADYARADQLRELTRDKVYKARVEPHWFANNERFWYRNDLPGGAREFILVVASEGRRMPAFDRVKLAEALTRTTEKPHDPARLPFD